MGAIVAIHRDAVFGPDDLQAMSKTLDAVCNELEIMDNGPAREIVAVRIIELAKRGERSPIKLRSLLLAEANDNSRDGYARSAVRTRTEQEHVNPAVPSPSKRSVTTLARIGFSDAAAGRDQELLAAYVKGVPLWKLSLRFNLTPQQIQICILALRGSTGRTLSASKDV